MLKFLILCTHIVYTVQWSRYSEVHHYLWWKKNYFLYFQRSLTHSPRLMTIHSAPIQVTIRMNEEIYNWSLKLWQLQSHEQNWGTWQVTCTYNHRVALTSLTHLSLPIYVLSSSPLCNSYCPSWHLPSSFSCCWPNMATLTLHKAVLALWSFLHLVAHSGLPEEDSLVGPAAASLMGRPGMPVNRGNKKVAMSAGAAECRTAGGSDCKDKWTHGPPIFSLVL